MTKKQLAEDEADNVNDVVSGTSYVLDAKSGVNVAKKLRDAARAARIARAFQAAGVGGRVLLRGMNLAKPVVKRAPVIGAALDVALLSHPDTRASVFREVEDDAANAGKVKRMVKGALSPIATGAGIVNMVNETNELMDKELIEAAEPDSRYLAKKRKEMKEASFQNAVEQRLAERALKISGFSDKSIR
jgi:hypothetical protein